MQKCLQGSWYDRFCHMTYFGINPQNTFTSNLASYQSGIYGAAINLDVTVLGNIQIKCKLQSRLLFVSTVPTGTVLSMSNNKRQEATR